MAFVERSNNRILPPNARATDVARRAIDEITPVQQQKLYAAFPVQGFQCVLYSHLRNGRKCSCQSTRKTINSILGQDGKASPGVINEMLTGNARFGISDYGSETSSYNQINRSNNTDSQFIDDYTITSPDLPYAKHEGEFDLVSRGRSYDQERIVGEGDFHDGEAFGDNGPLQDIDLDDLVGDFDIGGLGYSDVSCPVCFGTGYIGGYTVFNGQRTVIVPEMVSFDPDVDHQSYIDYTSTPFAAYGSFSAIVTLPRGAHSIDHIALYDGKNQIPYLMKIDGTKVDHQMFMSKLDGKPHTIRIEPANPKGTGPARWTHFELQFNTNRDWAYFEFPVMHKNSDITLLEQWDPFQLILSPNVPLVQTGDVITESTYGKTLVVQSGTWRNTRVRQMLGWECQVRVVQPTELYTILPKRGRVPTKPRTAVPVRDNIRGPRRT